ncbi:MAG: 2-keto-4-pentenoate hydratase, partial [Roseobacter sp.]
MKIATRPFPGKPHRKDGELLLVADDLQTCRPVADLILQDVLDAEVGGGDLKKRLGEEMPFDAAAAWAPLPRAYQFLDGSAYVNHVELVRKARGAKMPESFWTDPL